MANVLTQKANALKPQTRAALEAELGRALQDDEDVSIMAFSAHDAPVGKTRHQAGERLQAHLQRIDRQTEKLPPEEVEEALDEALRQVRPGYRERE